MPSLDDFRLTPSGQWERSAKSQRKVHEQEVPWRWCVLLPLVKAQLEAIEWAYSASKKPSSRGFCSRTGTYGDWAILRIDRVYETGEMPPLLPEPSRPLALPEGKR